MVSKQVNSMTPLQYREGYIVYRAWKRSIDTKRRELRELFGHLYTEVGIINLQYALLEKQSKFPRYSMKCASIVENQILHEIFNVVSRFPGSFHVISRKLDFLWDSVVCT